MTSLTIGVIWLLVAIVLHAKGADPAYTVGSIVCANLWLRP